MRTLLPNRQRHGGGGASAAREEARQQSEQEDKEHGRPHFSREERVRGQRPREGIEKDSPLSYPSSRLWANFDVTSAVVLTRAT